MSAPAQLTARACAACERNATGVLAKCRSKSYCSEACRNIDLERHQQDCPECNYRLRFRRCAAFNYTLFYAFRLRTWCSKEPVIIRTEERDGEFLVHTDVLLGSSKFCYFAGPPKKLLVGDPWNIVRILARSACQDAAAWMQQVIMHTFESLEVTISEAKVTTKMGTNVLITLTNGFIDAKWPLHEVFHIVLRDGAEFAYDITCPQYGDIKAITPWEEYFEKRIDKIIEATPIYQGRVRKDIVELKRKTEVEFQETICITSFALCANKMLSWVTEWEQSNMPFSEVLRLDNGGFEAKSGELLAFVKAKLDAYIRRELRVDFQNQWRKRNDPSCEFKILFDQCARK